MNLQTKQTAKIYWDHSKRYGLSIFLLVFSLIGGTLTDLYKPFLYKDFFNYLASNDPTISDKLFHVIWIILLVSTISWAFWRASTYTWDYLVPKVMSDLTNTCFAYLHGHSYNFFNNNFAGSLHRQANRLVDRYVDIISELYWKITSTFLRVLITLVVVFYLYPLLAFIILIWLVIYSSFMIWFANYKSKFDLIKSKYDTQTGGLLADTIANQANLKLFSSLKNEFREFQKLTGLLFKYRKLTWNLGSHVEAVQGGAMIILEFSVMYAAIHLWRDGAITVGDFALLQAYLIGIMQGMWDIERSYRHIFEGFADAKEMTVILNTPHEIQDSPNATKLKVTQGKIEFDQVSFAYHKKNIFNSFTLTIKPGERVGLIGPSGGGKSTITKLLFRFFEIQSGEILVDGQNISRVTQDSLRDNLSLVPQDPVLFHRSLLDNIRYAKPNATDQDVFRAAKLAHCHEFIQNFPEKYDTFVGERGVKLSGGERQRVAIARAILKDAPILVLDEATSSLDSQSEKYIQDALKKLMEGKTTIVIAHRLSTIMQMDRIVVLEKGKITEQGKHEELLKAQRGTYQKLWEIQAGGFN